MLILAMNPCYCGFYKDNKEKCKCSTREIERYWRKISGPMLDRIDIQISMPRERISRDKEEESESSGEIKTRVKKVYEKQIERNKKFDFDFNTQASPFAINEWLCADGSVKNIVYEYSRKLNLSSRQISSLIKVSRTIADMDDSDTITQEHIAEALQYKMILSKIYFSGSF
jgi:magnesium chelatase family protein